MLFGLKALATATLFSAAAFGLSVEVPGQFEIKAQPYGIDVSGNQPNVNWSTVVASGVSFVYIKTTEGTSYKNPQFFPQYTGATKAGLIRGGYHSALPDKSSGTVQANWFVAQGGGWSSDGITLPGALDMKSNPSGPPCYDLTAAAMVSWIYDFSNTYRSKTSRYPVIYTNTNWWKMCTSDSPVFASTSPLWIVRYNSSVGPLPNGWKYQTFWQYADKGPVPGNQDYFNGDMNGLKLLAKGS